MKSLLLLVTLLTFNVCAAVRELPPIQKQDVIKVGKKNYGLGQKNKEKKEIGQLKEKEVLEINEISRTIQDFKKVTTEIQNWQETLDEINNTINDLKRIIAKTKNSAKLKEYDGLLTELRFYRGIVNLHLHNYGIALLDIQYVVKKDKSYLEKKPIIYFKQELTLDEVMKAVWKYLHKLDTYYCTLGLNNSACNEAIYLCYTQSWGNECRATQMPTQPYNNPNLIDIEDVLNYYHLDLVCKYCLFKNKETPYTPSYGVVTSFDPNKPTTQRCMIYNTNKAMQYLGQLTKFQNITSTSKLEVEDYLCRGFTNVMLIGEGTTVSNQVYINNAKADIKIAIAKNNGLPAAEQLVEIDDDIMTAIFNKYNQFVTKDMTQEQIALINDAVSKPKLDELKKQMEDNSNTTNQVIAAEGITTTPSSNLTVDNIPDEALLNNTGYSSNALQNLTNISGITANGATTDAQKTDGLLNGSRMTQMQANQTHATLDTMLEMIDNLKATGDY
jgi:hypothetical protein